MLTSSALSQSSRYILYHLVYLPGGLLICLKGIPMGCPIKTWDLHSGVLFGLFQMGADASSFWFWVFWDTLATVCTLTEVWAPVGIIAHPCTAWVVGTMAYCLKGDAASQFQSILAMQKCRLSIIRVSHLKRKRPKIRISKCWSKLENLNIM